MATASKTKPGKGFPHRVYKEEGPMLDTVGYGTFVVFPKQDVGKVATPIRVPTAFVGESPMPQTGSDTSEIIIDANSGIPIEEQREILVKINGIAEKNRRSLSAGAENRRGSGKHFKAKKNDGLFPVMVNFLAITALVGGLFALYSLQSEVYVQAREGTRVLNTTERVIIEEIRRKTNDLLLAKDLEIAILTSWLAEVDTQMELIARHEMLSLEQMITYDRLMVRQEELRMALALAREERSRILNESRRYEAVLQSQFNTRIQIETQMQEFAAIGEEPPLEQLSAYEQLRFQQEEFRAALTLMRTERYILLNEARAREAELQAQLDARHIIEAQLMEFAAIDDAWTPERQTAYEQLRFQEEELRAALVQSWEERSILLDGTRMREAELQAQLDAHVYEFDLRADTRAPELEAALNELAQLSMEQTQAERVEALIASLFASANRQLVENRFDDAGETLRELRVVLYTPAFQAIHTVQSRREIYIQATDALETLLGRYMIANQAIHTAMLQLYRDTETRAQDELAQVGALPPVVVPEIAVQDEAVQVGALPPTVIPEIAIQDEAVQVGALPPAVIPEIVVQGETVQLGREAEFELQQEVVRLTAELTAREYIINSMRTHMESPVQFVTQLESTIGTLQTTNATLNAQMSNLQQTNSALATQVSNLQSANSALTTQVNSLQTTNATLNTRSNTLEATNNTLQTTNMGLNTQLGTLQTTNSTLNTQVNTLNTQVDTLNAQVNTLNMQMDTLQANLGTQTRTSESLRQENQTLRQEVQFLQASNSNLSSLLSRLQQAVLDH